MIINSGWYFHFKFLLLPYNISLVNIFFNFNKFNISCYCKDAKNVLKLEYGPWVYKYLISTFLIDFLLVYQETYSKYADPEYHSCQLYLGTTLQKEVPFKNKKWTFSQGTSKNP